MSSSWEGSIGIWLAIATGVITGLGTAFGVWREWQIYRQNQITRLNNAAIVAVRRSEATVVRPILINRMSDVISEFVQTHNNIDTSRFRVLLFKELYARVRMSEEEKHLAKSTAIHYLIDILQSMPSPPLRIKTERQLSRNSRAVHELVETAYKTCFLV